MTLRKRYVLAFWLIALFTASPFISVFIAGAVATANGCRLDEAGFYPCVILGHDFGALLGSMGVLGWMGLMTLPIGSFLMFLLGVAALVHFFRDRREAASKASPDA